MHLWQLLRFEQTEICLDILMVFFSRNSRYIRLSINSSLISEVISLPWYFSPYSSKPLSNLSFISFVMYFKDLLLCSFERVLHVSSGLLRDLLHFVGIVFFFVCIFLFFFDSDYIFFLMLKVFHYFFDCEFKSLHSIFP